MGLDIGRAAQLLQASFAMFDHGRQSSDLAN
jgi:hypothetical protein